MLLTERTRMTPVSESDYDEVLEMFHEPETFRYIQPLCDKSDEWYRSFLDGKRRLAAEGKGYYFVVRVKNGGDYIGSANLYPFRDTAMVQLGCQLKRAFWGRGFATELMVCVRDHAFDSFGLDELFGFFDPENRASRRILNKLGFGYHGLMEPTGGLVEVHRLTRPLWQML